MKEKVIRIKIIRAMLDSKITVADAVAMQELSGQALYGAALSKGIIQ
jgi:hypothetical protein